MTSAWRQLASKLIIITAAVAAIALGVSLAPSKNLLESFVGAFLVVSGVQITLWILGIRLEILANTSDPGTIRPQEVGPKSSNVDSIDARLQNIEGRLVTTLGYVMAETSMKSSTSLEPGDRDRLEEAVSLLQKGYESLKDVGGPGEYMALNNLVFYSSILGDRSRRHFLLSQGRTLLAAGQEHDNINLILTACLAILRFSDISEEREEAIAILRFIEKADRTTNRQRKEASLYIEQFSQQLDRVESVAAPNQGPQPDATATAAPRG